MSRVKNRFYKSIYSLVLISVIFGSFLFSCTDVITVDLNNADPKIVIEGVITDQAGPYTVSIHRTTNYFTPGDPPAVSGAVVQISDNTGNSETLEEIGNGVYITSTIEGVPGRTYTLNVTADGQEYIAVSTLPVALELDSVIYEPVESEPDEFDVICFFQDRDSLEDYVRLKLYNNDILSPEYYLYDDRLTDGMYIDYEFYDEIITTGNSIQVEVLTFDREVYEYFSTLWNIVTYDSDDDDEENGGEETIFGQPANPLSNLSNGALGYFGAIAVRSYSFEIK